MIQLVALGLWQWMGRLSLLEALLLAVFILAYVVLNLARHDTKT
jgi:hypothetical protein